MTAYRLRSRAIGVLISLGLVLASLSAALPTADAAPAVAERIVTLTPTKSNYVSKAAPKKVYSKKSTTRASKAAYAAYLEFAPIKLAPGESITSATLQVHATSLTGKKKTAKISVSPVERGWTASKLNYKNKPKLLSGHSTATKTLKPRQTTKISLDAAGLTDQLQAGAAFRLTNKTANSSILLSGKGARAPQLVISIKTVASPPEAAGTSFSIAVIPDTQNEVFTESDQRYANRTQWLVDNKDRLNLAYVLHTGDNVSHGWLAPSQYDMATRAISILNHAGVPYALTIGNHDTRAVGWDGVDGSTGYGGAAYMYNPECLERLGNTACKSHLLLRETDEFNNAFPLTKLKNVGGVYQEGKVDNTWTTFAAADTRWLVLTLELWPRTEVLSWAEKVVAEHPKHNVIIQTHHYLDSNGTVSKSSGGYGKTAPVVLYDQIVSKYSNVKFVFSGHNGKFTKRTDTNDGNVVVSYLGNDLRDHSNPVRVLTINTTTGTVTGKVYNPIGDTTVTAYNTSDTIRVVR